MPAQEDYETLQGLAQRLQLDEKEADGFIKSSMQRLGYRPRVQWDEPENENGNEDEGGDFFSGKRRQREQRPVNNQQQQQQGGRRASGGGWQYED